MFQKTFKITSEEGLHARPASLLSGLATKYSGIVDIEYNGIKNTLKSIMIVMSLGVACNESVTFHVEDENALVEIENLLNEHKLI